MKLNDEEQAMLAGDMGRVPQIAIEHQIKVGDFFGAPDFVPVTQAHIMADTESLGEAGVAWLERMADEDGGRGRVRIPTITDPRGTDFAKAALLKHAPWMLTLERRTIDAFIRLGVSMTDTCINYQTIQAPTQRRARRLRRYRRRDLFQLDLRRPLELRGWPVGARGRAHRPHATLRLPPRGAAPGDRAFSRRVDAEDAERLGRARRRDRQARRQLLGGAGGRRPAGLAGLRRDEALRRGDGELRLERAVPPGRHHTRGAPPRRRRAATTFRSRAASARPT